MSLPDRRCETSSAPVSPVATMAGCTAASHRLRVRSDIEGPRLRPLTEGAAGWSATGLESRGCRKAWGSIPPPSSKDGEPGGDLASPAKRLAPPGVGFEPSAIRTHGSDASLNVGGDRDELWLTLLDLEDAGWVEVGASVRLLRLDRVGTPLSRPLTFVEAERAKVTPAVRQAVIDRDGALCRACGATEYLAIDHVLALSMGGTSAMDNLAVLCRPCNSSKGAKPWDQWIKGRHAAH